MYAGPGSGPMLAAASAWNALAAELRSTATSYESVISRMTSDGWRGPASSSMAAAAAPYTAWLHSSAGQAEHTAQQANAAAAAYAAAFAATVPPPVVAANRAQQAALVATNVLGQNTPAIAATEAHYGEMWAQDAAAMYGYAGNSAAASAVTPFAAPHRTTNPAAPANQGAAVAQATGTSASSGVQSTLSQVVSTTPGTLQGLASPTQPGSATSGLSGMLGSNSFGNVSNDLTNLTSSSISPLGVAGATQIATDFAILRGAALAAGDPFGLGAGLGGGVGTMGLGGFGALQAGAFGPAGSGAAAFAPANLSGSGAASAGIGRATMVGAMSVPPGWAAPAPPVANPSTGTALVSSWAAAPDAGASGTPGMPGMPMTGTGGRGFGFAAPRYGFKPTIMARPVIAG
jgi:PPE-repeat protein